EPVPDAASSIQALAFLRGEHVAAGRETMPPAGREDRRPSACQRLFQGRKGGMCARECPVEGYSDVVGAHGCSGIKQERLQPASLRGWIFALRAGFRLPEQGGD